APPPPQSPESPPASAPAPTRSSESPTAPASAPPQSSDSPSAPASPNPAEPLPAQGPTLTRAPVLDHFVEAPYPPEAGAENLEGRFLRSTDTSVTGRVTGAEVVEPAGHGFDEAALAAVRQFHFSPAEVDGKPSPVRITYAYDFVLRPAPAEVQVTQESPVNFTGRVLERGNRKPLAGAEVALPALGTSTMTDARGQFSFRDLPAGDMQVIITAAEFQRFETTERIDPGRETRAVYHVLRTFYSPYETVVRGVREKKEVSQTTISLEEIQRIPGTTGDALKVVQNLPGVARPPLNGGLIVIRGT